MLPALVGSPTGQTPPDSSSSDADRRLALPSTMVPSTAHGEQPADEIDFWSSYPINWPALYALAALFLGVVGLCLWVGQYETAATTALIAAGSAGVAYDGILDHLGQREDRRWYWAGLGIWGLVTVWNLIGLAGAWFARGG